MIDPTDLRDVFDRAASLAPQDRAAFLAQVCGENVALRQEVERLLAADARAGSVFSADSSDGGTDSGETAPGSRPGLSPGARLGPYVVIGPLGAGGMGEVYKARDTRLDRTVALKVLPADRVSSPDARQRFEREARAAAALAHAHICRLLDVGRQGDTDYLVMELLDGETLAERLKRGKLPLRQALTFGTQIAGALVVAHRAGIVHRDLKPGNIMLTAEGAVLLDFGLARRTAPLALDAPTATIHDPITRTGMILGTVQYMAPEQLEGRPVDARTDIFALGVVLYEMVTGRRAFEGSNHASVIGNILHADPPSASAIDGRVPLALDWLIRRCLAKDPADRWPTITELQARLEALRDLLRDGAGTEPATEARLSPRTARRWAVTVGAVVLMGGGAGWWAWVRSTAGSNDRTVQRATVQRNLTRLTFDPGLQTDPTFSPDGRFIAYASDKAGNFDIWVQPVSGGDAVQVTRSSAQDTQPDWSPDGTTIVFRSEREGGGLFTVPALGGVERRVADFGVRPRSSPDGSRILFVDTLAFETNRFNPNAFAIDATGGAPTRVGRELWPTLGWIKALDWHPDGRISVLSIPGGAARADREPESRDAQLVTLSQDESHVVISPISSDVRSLLGSCTAIPEFRWSASGRHVVLVCESETTRNVWSIETTQATLALNGPVQRLTAGGEFDHRVALSRNGLAAFSNQTAVTRIWQYRIDDDTGRVIGNGTPVTPGDFSVGSSAVSRDGRTLTYAGTLVGGRQQQVWKTSLESVRPELQIADARPRRWLRVSPDGSVCYTRRDEDGHFRIAYVGQRDRAEHVLAESAQLILPFDWMPGGDGILGSAGLDEKRPFAVVAWPMRAAPHAERSVRLVLSDTHMNLWNARYSPNGRWICLNANTGDLGGVSVIGVASAQGATDRPWLHVTSDVDWSDKPRWSSNGSILFYVTGYRRMAPNVWAIPIAPATGRPVGEPRRVTAFDNPARGVPQDIDISTIDVGQGRLIVPVTELSGGIWMLDNADR